MARTRFTVSTLPRDPPDVRPDRSQEAHQAEYFEKQDQFTLRDLSGSMVPIYETSVRILQAVLADDKAIFQEFPELSEL
jgi:hypothetical protein